MVREINVKWKLFRHICVIRLPINTLATNESTKYYFKVPEKIKKYRGIPRTRYQRPQTDRQRYKTSSEEKSPRWQVLPVKQFISTKDLGVLRMLAQERDVWEDLLNVICSA